MRRPIAIVVEATTRSGGGFADAVLDDPRRPFSLRVVFVASGAPPTRAPTARAWAARGAEIISAEPGDVPGLARALTGGHALFVPAEWPSPGSAGRARAVAEAVREAGLEHVVWTDLDGSDPSVDGQLDGVPTTVLRPGVCWEALLGAGLRPGPGAELELALPLGNACLPGIAAGDIGRCAYGIVQGGLALAGIDVGVSGDHLTGGEMAEALTRRLGRSVRYRSATAVARVQADADERVFNLVRAAAASESAYRALRPTSTSRRLNADLLSFEGWLGQLELEHIVSPPTDPDE